MNSVRTFVSVLMLAGAALAMAGCATNNADTGNDGANQRTPIKKSS